MNIIIVNNQKIKVAPFPFYSQEKTKNCPELAEKKNSLNIHQYETKVGVKSCRNDGFFFPLKAETNVQSQFHFITKFFMKFFLWC